MDDGSLDTSSELLDRIVSNDSRVRLVSLSRNFGHQIAVSAGLDASEGNVIVVLDADLQDPPELIPSLIAKWEAGADVVHAVRETRLGESLYKKTTSHLFYRLIRRMTDLNMQVDAGDFRLMDRAVADALRSMPETFRFIRGMVAWIGFRQESVPYVRDERFAGVTKYPNRAMLRLALTAITSFSFIPLEIASAIGIIISGLTVIAIPIVITLRLLGVGGLGGQTTVLIAILLFGGFQMMFLGVIGEYLGRLYIEAKRRPLYIVKSTIRYEGPGQLGEE